MQHKVSSLPFSRQLITIKLVLVITRVLGLKTYQSFGLVENPIWQLAQIEENTDRNERIHWLVPLDTLSSTLVSAERDRLKEYQTFLSLESLKEPSFLEALKSDQEVQIWIDRIVSSEESEEIGQILNQFKKVTLVYLPDLHAHPQQVFEHVNLGEIPILLHLNTKLSSFDKWLSPFEMWDRIAYLLKFEKLRIVGFQLLECQLDKSLLPSEKLFLLNPSYDHMMLALKERKAIGYEAQKMTRAIFKSLSPTGRVLLRQVIVTLLSPNRKNFKNLLVFKNLIIFYPIRKLYWILEHAIVKRFFKETNEKN